MSRRPDIFDRRFKAGASDPRADEVPDYIQPAMKTVPRAAKPKMHKPSRMTVTRAREESPPRRYGPVFPQRQSDVRGPRVAKSTRPRDADVPQSSQRAHSVIELSSSSDDDRPQASTSVRKITARPGPATSKNTATASTGRASNIVAVIELDSDSDIDPPAPQASTSTIRRDTLNTARVEVSREDRERCGRASSPASEVDDEVRAQSVRSEESYRDHDRPVEDGGFFSPDEREEEAEAIDDNAPRWRNGLRTRKAQKQQSPLPTFSDDASSPSPPVTGTRAWDANFTPEDKIVWALYLERRLPFLLRNLRRALSLSQTGQAGLNWEEVREFGIERWVCPVCPLGGIFETKEGRDMHVAIWHREFTGSLQDQRTRVLHPPSAPVRARVYIPPKTQRQAKRVEGRSFPHVSERVTGLGPMPDFGYMTDRMRLEEARILSHPGGQRVFVAAWKRWIYQYRQLFVRDPVVALGSFLHAYADAVRIAGKDVLRAWLLALVNQRHLGAQGFVRVYGDWAKSEKLLHEAAATSAP
ncbi:hypothetical protein EXIGLDRAFT_654497 [Exidia glandulosa HHB12029]|uniref:Uncharacterized protein n=1 Tax=Exidia glandulosa HHB12029 TaxID=1314781 RepID=A0A165ZQK3_EXIGL|nr:hypothetical protein EXIGLDRAFT_654497 [Exidia glandulosa HHB12029]